MKKLLKIILGTAIICAVTAVAINIYVVKSTDTNIMLTASGDILTEDDGSIAAFAGNDNAETDIDAAENSAQEEILDIKEFGADCILVLGAGLKPDGTPNHMLEDRLELALALYNSGAAPKLLLSGDHGQEQYDEVNAMKKYMEDAGVPPEDIFLDHAGFSTYESMYRSGTIFDVKKAIVVTQTYHQYRALYIGEKLGLEVIGAASDQRAYTGQTYRDMREIVARDKDFFKALFRPEPTYTGDSIPISGSGLESHD